MKAYLNADLLDQAVKANARRESSKIIFLVIDGVMHDYSTDDIVQEERVQILKKIVEATGAELILSSSWRLGYPEFLGENQLTEYISDHESKSLADLKQMLAKYDLEISGFTPYSLLGENGRPLEIRTFLLDRADVRSFVILDDEAFNWQWLRQFWVQTKSPVGIHPDGSFQYRYGLEETHAEKAIRILNRFD